MKPKRIILIRHGESEGNVDKKVYLTKPDYAINLTEKGRKQAEQAGKEIAKLFERKKLTFTTKPLVQFYVSPFYRARQTYQEIAKSFAPHIMREDPRIREQEWCGKMHKDGYSKIFEEERDVYGHFYYRFLSGESCADVYERVTTFMDTLHRDFEKKDFPENCVIVTHGMTLRVLVMRWFHLSVEEFEYLRNPHNCQYYVLELQANNKYKLVTKMEKYPDRRARF